MADRFETRRETCVHIAGMIEHAWEVVITHDNAPQVGFILSRSKMPAMFCAPYHWTPAGLTPKGPLDI